MSFNPLVQGSSWSDVAKRGLHVPATKLRSKPDRKIINSVKSEVVFEVPGYTAKQISQKAAAILRRALNPDAIIFELPKGIMNPDVVVEEIEKQTGPIAGFTNLGQYRRDINNLILEIVFMQEESAKKAMTNGVTINEVVYRGSPWVDEVRRTTGSSFAFSNVTQSLRTLIATVATIFTTPETAAEAESIVKRALNPGSVLFEFHDEAFDKEDAYDLIVKEIGPVNGVRPISEYRKSPRGNLLIEATVN
ncbi:hypothetical protein Unana1_02366 [Umbelopsis nana]